MKSGPSGPFLPIDPFEIALDLGLRVFTGRGMSAGYLRDAEEGGRI